MINMKKPMFRRLAETMKIIPESKNDGNSPYAGYFSTENIHELLNTQKFSKTIVLLNACLEEEGRTGNTGNVVQNFQSAIHKTEVEGAYAKGGLITRLVTDTLEKGGAELECLKKATKLGLDLNEDDFCGRNLTDKLLDTEHLKTAHTSLGLTRAPSEYSTFYNPERIHQISETENLYPFLYKRERVTTRPQYSSDTALNDTYVPDTSRKLSTVSSYLPKRMARLNEYHQDPTQKGPVPLRPGSLVMRLDNLAYLVSKGVVEKEKIEKPDYVASVLYAVGTVTEQEKRGEISVPVEDKEMFKIGRYFKDIGVNPNVVDVTGRNALTILVQETGIGSKKGSFYSDAISTGISEGISIDTPSMLHSSTVRDTLKEQGVLGSYVKGPMIETSTPEKRENSLEQARSAAREQVKKDVPGLQSASSKKTPLKPKNEDER
jgi:hypothetical protein